MQHEIKKITRIVDEMLTMFMLNATDEMEVKIKKRFTKKTSIYFTQHQCTFDEAYIEQLRKKILIYKGNVKLKDITGN